MKRVLITLALLSTSLLSHADCWIISGLHGKSSFSEDGYDFIDDSVTGAAFKMTINGNKASITNLDGDAISEVSYVPLSNNTIVGSYQAGGGITVETWSITTDKKAMYSKVMNIPGFQKLTSTKAFVGDVVGNCDK
ncbi:hypothetical protein [Yersinia rochesterensis]|uniref:hypothetical protein n=1 Tax=Yersinia rochesterensis TaxID=1604335 RepID=UPI0011A50271|nr:hypothetical protein [Yersinia rochesterensis]